jgi:hypothetical protein
MRIGSRGSAEPPVPGGVERNEAVTAHPSREWVPHAGVRADAGDQQQGNAVAVLGGDPHAEPADAHVRRLHLNAPIPVMSRPTISACIVSVPS